MTADAFDHILGQPQVRDFLRSSVTSDRISHAYLFTGPAGSNKLQAAFAFAQALVCPKGAQGPKGGMCGACQNCSRASRKVHPDVHYLSPEGSSTYLVQQMRELVSDVMLAPIQAQRKIYILDRVDLMNAATANAFLKTLEEPPENVVFILLGRTRESVLPTIVSRCQTVPFRHIPPSEAAGIVAQNTAADTVLAKQAIEACGGSITRAIVFIKEKNHRRIEFRAELLRRLAQVPHMDDLQIITFARELLAKSDDKKYGNSPLLINALLDEYRAHIEQEFEQNKDLYEKSIIRQIEDRNKRQLSAKTMEYLHQFAYLTLSWMRDILVVASGAEHLIINTDYAADIQQIGTQVRARVPQINASLMRISELDDALNYNVSPETCFDAILFSVREVLR